MLTLRVMNKGIKHKILQYCCFSSVKSTNIDKPILYGDEISPPVRFVMMTASALDIDIEFRKIDLFKSENRTDFYQKINPLKKVPAMIVSDTNILDSHAIALYLCQIAKHQKLYPEDPIIRAKVNQILFYNSGTLFPIDSFLMSKYFAREWPVNKAKIEEWYTALDYLEYHFKDNWLTGNKMLLCDICVVAVVTSVRLLIPLTDRHKRIQKWIDQFQGLKFFDINRRGLANLQFYIDAINYEHE